jgi:hypothetical protein
MNRPVLMMRARASGCVSWPANGGWFGCRRLGSLLAREDMVPSHKKRPRIYREKGLNVRHRGGCKRALRIRCR